MDKIYITSLHLLHGGVEMAITLLANALVSRNFEVEILCIYDLGKPAYQLDKRVRVSYLTDVHPNREEFYSAVRNKNVLSIIREGIYSVRVLYLKKIAMTKAIKKIKTGVVISTRNEHSVLLSHYGQKNVKKIAQLHHDHNFDKKLLRDFQEHYGNIDYFVLLTDLLRDEVKEIMKSNKHTKCVAIPNFLSNISRYKNNKRKRQVIAVGRLHEVKGFERLIKIWGQADIQKDIILKIVGDGEEKDHLVEVIREHKLEEKVILTGSLEHEQVIEEMQQSLFYVMTSFSEGFPFVLIEAMSCGLPVVAFDVRVGPAAIIEDGKSGYLVTESDGAGFIEKVKLLCDEPELREQMSINAVNRSRQFSEERVMAQWMEIIEGV